MKKRGNLRLVCAHNGQCRENGVKKILGDIFSDFFVSKNEKIYVLKDIITRLYRDYEITTGYSDIPYFVKAENKIRQIIYERKINYYYNMLKKYRRYAK